jgi:hypothetical protein
MNMRAYEKLPFSLREVRGLYDPAAAALALLWQILADIYWLKKSSTFKNEIVESFSGSEWFTQSSVVSARRLC